MPNVNSKEYSINMNSYYIQMFFLLFVIWIMFYIVYFVLIVPPSLRFSEEINEDIKDIEILANDFNKVIVNTKDTVDDIIKLTEELSPFGDSILPLYCRATTLINVKPPEICFKNPNINLVGNNNRSKNKNPNINLIRSKNNNRNKNKIMIKPEKLCFGNEINTGDF